MIYLLLYYEFFKIGLFAIGGGYTTIPFLYHISVKYNWFSVTEITDMLAISQLTPGPVGINMATYAGYNTGGVLGAIIATVAIITPASIIVVLVSKALKKYQDNSYIKSIMYHLKAATVGLLLAALFQIFKTSVITDTHFDITQPFHSIDIKALILLTIVFFATLKYQKNIILCLIVSGILGIIFKQVL